MMLNFKIVTIVVLTLGLVTFSSSAQEIIPTGPAVRVLLDQNPINNKQWMIHSTAPIHIKLWNTHHHTYLYYKVNAQKLSIKYQDGMLIINNKRFENIFAEITPSIGHHLFFDGREYEGNLVVLGYLKNILLINQISLENYIYSVLKSESWPGWPAEVNMAFAIACRSYVASRMMQSRKKKLPYDIKNTNIHQTYQGFHTQYRLQEAVKRTEGLVLTHNNKPIVAMFDCCCGGIIPANMHGVNFKHAPYLARTRACTYCKHSKLYRWHLEIDQHDLEKLFQEQGIKISDLRDIVISQQDKAGVVHELIVHGKGGPIKVTGKKIYGLIKALKSYCYAIEKKSKKIILRGSGYGHHLGMCQWGARRMIDEGHSHQSILSFYYPQTKLMKLAYHQPSPDKNNARV